MASKKTDTPKALYVVADWDIDFVGAFRNKGELNELAVRHAKEQGVDLEDGPTVFIADGKALRFSYEPTLTPFDLAVIPKKG